MSAYPSARRITLDLRLLVVPPVVQAGLVFLGVGLFYVCLYGQLPYHDVARFVSQVSSGHYVWDIGHILLQPATLLWHRYLGFGETAEQSQKHINSFATALAIAIFYYTLVRLQRPAWECLVASSLLAATCSVITLAPTGHMKLLAFPFVNGSLLALLLWERTAEERGSDRLALLAAGMLLGLAGAFLASSLATVPFATLAVFLGSWRKRATFRRAFENTVAFGGACTVIFGASAILGYLLFSGQSLSLHGLQQSVTAKADLRPAGSVPGLSIAGLVRVVYGTVGNFVASPNLGSDGRAFLAGDIKNFVPYLPDIFWEVVPTLLTLALLAVIYLRSANAVLRGRAVLAPLAFLSGAQAWTIYYGLNDPEHWFQLAAPTIILFLLTFSQRSVKFILPFWAAGTLAANLAFFAIPQALYPLHRYEREIDGMYTRKDMLVYFATYPGTHYLGFFDLPAVQTLRIDQVLQDAHDPTAGFQEIRNRILTILDSGGKVIVYSILAPHDWNGGWASLKAHKISKSEVLRFLDENFRVAYNGQVAEMPTWRVQRK